MMNCMKIQQQFERERMRSIWDGAHWDGMKFSTVPCAAKPKKSKNKLLSFDDRPSNLMGGGSSTGRYESSFSVEDDHGRQVSEKLKRANSGRNIVPKADPSTLNVPVYPGYLAVPSLNRSPFCDYQLEKKVGEGGYSVVHKGVSVYDEKIVAIKEINLKRLSKRQLEALQLETNILSQLSHSSIVKLVSIFTVPGKLFMVQEYLSGGELLAAICKQTTYTEADARRILTEITNAVQYLHSRNVIHRDIKPENLILANKNFHSTVKLVDFGFSIVLTEPVYHSTFKCGTPGYMAPEVISEQSYSKAVDIWSLGVVMYILLSGTMPFDEHDDSRVMTGSFDFPVKRWGAVSESAKSLIRKMLIVSPSHRFTAMQVLLHPWMLLPIPLHPSRSFKHAHHSEPDKDCSVSITQASIASCHHNVDISHNLEVLRAHHIQVQKCRPSLIVIQAVVKFQRAGRLRRLRRITQATLARRASQTLSSADIASLQSSAGMAGMSGTGASLATRDRDVTSPNMNSNSNKNAVVSARLLSRVASSCSSACPTERAAAATAVLPSSGGGGSICASIKAFTCPIVGISNCASPNVCLEDTNNTAGAVGDNNITNNNNNNNNNNTECWAVSSSRKNSNNTTIESVSDTHMDNHSEAAQDNRFQPEYYMALGGGSESDNGSSGGGGGGGIAYGNAEYFGTALNNANGMDIYRSPARPLNRSVLIHQDFLADTLSTSSTATTRENSLNTISVTDSFRQPHHRASLVDTRVDSCKSMEDEGLSQKTPLFESNGGVLLNHSGSNFTNNSNSIDFGTGYSSNGFFLDSLSKGMRRLSGGWNEKGGGGGGSIGGGGPLPRMPEDGMLQETDDTEPSDHVGTHRSNMGAMSVNSPASCAAVAGGP